MDAESTNRLRPPTANRIRHHHNAEETFLMLEGTLEVTINGKSSRISRGSVAFIGSAGEHGVRNRGRLWQDTTSLSWGRKAELSVRRTDNGTAQPRPGRQLRSAELSGRE